MFVSYDGSSCVQACLHFLALGLVVFLNDFIRLRHQFLHFSSVTFLKGDVRSQVLLSLFFDFIREFGSGVGGRLGY